MHRTQPIWRIALSVSITFGLAGAFVGACGGSDNNACDPSSDPTCNGGDAGGDAKPPGGGAAGCKTAGLACTVATDCCNLVCTGGSCSATACIDDNAACTAS